MQDGRREGDRMDRRLCHNSLPRGTFLFRCAVASLYEVVSVRPSVRRSVRRSACPVLFSKVKSTHTWRILSRVSGLVFVNHCRSYTAIRIHNHTSTQILSCSNSFLKYIFQLQWRPAITDVKGLTDFICCLRFFPIASIGNKKK